MRAFVRTGRCHSNVAVFGSSSSAAPPRRTAALVHLRRISGHLRVHNSLRNPFWPFSGTALASLAGDTPGELAVEAPLLSDGFGACFELRSP